MDKQEGISKTDLNRQRLKIDDELSKCKQCDFVQQVCGSKHVSQRIKITGRHATMNLRPPPHQYIK